MHIRIARHTADLSPIIEFYTEVLGLEILGSFNNHKGYDGVFLGYEYYDWHFEFTQSCEPPVRKYDEDDMVVIYPTTLEEYVLLTTKLKEKGVNTVAPKNPYWEQNGLMFLDPDGGRIVISPNQIEMEE